MTPGAAQLKPFVHQLSPVPTKQIHEKDLLGPGPGQCGPGTTACFEIDDIPLQPEVIVENLVKAPKRKTEEKPAPNKRAKGSDSTEKCEKKLCDLCPCRGKPAEKTNFTRMYAVDEQSKEMQEYLTVSLRIEGLASPKRGKNYLDQKSKVCEACFKYLQRKYNGEKRTAADNPQPEPSSTDSPQPGPSSLIEHPQGQIGEPPPMEPIPSDPIAMDPVVKKPQPDEVLPQATPETVCAVCKFTIFGRKKRRSGVHTGFKLCDKNDKLLLKRGGIEFKEEEPQFVHLFCKKTVQKKIVKLQEHSQAQAISEEDTHQFEEKELALQKFFDAASSEIQQEKKPMIFKTMFKLFTDEFLVNADPEFHESGRRWFRHRVTNWAKENGIQYLTHESDTMFYHKDVNFATTYKQELRGQFDKSPQSDSSLAGYYGFQLKAVLSSEKTILFNALSLLRDDLSEGGKFCEIYARYPLLLTNLRLTDYIYGKPVRVKTLDQKNKRAIIPPLPARLWNFFVALCLPKNSPVTSLFNEGHVTSEKHFFSEQLPTEFYSSVVNLIFTVLHKFNKRNIYPWAIAMAEVLDHRSKQRKKNIFAALGIAATDRKLRGYKESIAVLNQEQLMEGHPYGLIEGTHASVHLDNKEFQVQHGVKIRLHQYLAGGVIQPLPTDPDMKLPLNQSDPDETSHQLQDFCEEEFAAMFPNQLIISGDDIAIGDDEPIAISTSHVALSGEDHMHESGEINVPEAPVEVTGEGEVLSETSQTSQMEAVDEEISSFGTPTTKQILAPTGGTPHITPRYDRPHGKIILKHEDIEDYTVPQETPPPLRIENTLLRSHFLIESLDDLECEAKYKTMAHVHANLRLQSSVENTEGKTTELIFPGLRDHLRIQYAEVEASVFVYLLVVKGVPNSKKVLLHVMQLLTKIFIHGKKMKTIVVTADAVELNVLYKIREDYGILFSHFRFYYGFWHALVNYLIQFFKIYRTAGVEVMLEEAEPGSRMERVMRVTPDWSHSNRLALLVAEALMREQWKCFKRHVHNNLQENEVKLLSEVDRRMGEEKLNEFEAKVKTFLSKVEVASAPVVAPKASKELFKTSTETDSTIQNQGDVDAIPDSSPLPFLPDSPPEEPEAENTDSGDSADGDAPEGDASDGEADAGDAVGGDAAAGDVADEDDDDEDFVCEDVDDEDEDDDEDEVLSKDMNPSPKPVEDVSESEVESDTDEQPHISYGSKDKDEISKNQQELQDFFKREILPHLTHFEKLANAKDQVYCLNNNMLNDLMVYVYGYLSMRFNDFKGQQMVGKMMFKRVFSSGQVLYKHILKEQLREVALWDSFDLQCFEKSPGANELGGRSGVSLARDEAHERVISLGLAHYHPIHPTPENVEILCKSAPIISQNQDNLQKQFFPSTVRSEPMISRAKLNDDAKYLNLFQSHLEKHNSFVVQEGRALIQPGAVEPVHKDQAKQFLSRHKLSRETAEAVVDQQILNASTYDRVPLKRKAIPALPPLGKTPAKRRGKTKESMESRLITNLMMNNLKQQQGETIESLPGMGVAKFPPLFFDGLGNANTNTAKSTYKSVLLKRYGEQSFFYQSRALKSEKAVIIDGMPCLFLAPILGLKTFGDYVDFLLKRKVTKYFLECTEIHVTFDQPNIWGFNLKKKVQEERDAKKKQVHPLKEDRIDRNTKIPCKAGQWPGFLANREDKNKLVQFIGESIFELKDTLEDQTSIIVGGCMPENKTFKVEKGNISVIDELYCNHEEADTRIFAHAKWSSKPVLQLVAADTDILSILLLNFQHFSGKKVLLDQSDSSKVIDVNALIDAINDDKDQDLMVLKQKGDISLPQFFGLIHPLIGSDILCSPRNFGPAWILKACIDFSEILFDKDQGVQCLGEENATNFDVYIRFILALFKKKYVNKIKRKPLELLGRNANLEESLDDARQELWMYTLENNTVIPSKECLVFRGKNLSFQLKIWMQATKPQITVPDPLSHGWEETAKGLRPIPETKENMQKQANVYDHVMKKCRCKKSQCKNGRCACCNSKTNCTSFCECENCCNPFAKEAKEPVEETDSEEEMEQEELEEPNDGSEIEEADDDVY